MRRGSWLINWQAATEPAHPSVGRRLHVARAHLPRLIRSEAKARGLEPVLLVIHQNQMSGCTPGSTDRPARRRGPPRARSLLRAQHHAAGQGRFEPLSGIARQESNRRAGNAARASNRENGRCLRFRPWHISCTPEGDGH
jgi:hypothetical protein